MWIQNASAIYTHIHPFLTPFFWRWVPVKGGKERVDVGVYGRCILYPHMKTEE
jgi:hypothetical protein